MLEVLDSRERRRIMIQADEQQPTSGREHLLNSPQELQEPQEPQSSLPLKRHRRSASTPSRLQSEEDVAEDSPRLRSTNIRDTMGNLREGLGVVAESVAEQTELYVEKFLQYVRRPDIRNRWWWRGTCMIGLISAVAAAFFAWGIVCYCPARSLAAATKYHPVPHPTCQSVHITCLNTQIQDIFDFPDVLGGRRGPRTISTRSAPAHI